MYVHERIILFQLKRLLVDLSYTIQCNIASEVQRCRVSAAVRIHVVDQFLSMHARVRT